MFCCGSFWKSPHPPLAGSDVSDVSGQTSLLLHSYFYCITSITLLFHYFNSYCIQCLSDHKKGSCLQCLCSSPGRPPCVLISDSRTGLLTSKLTAESDAVFLLADQPLRSNLLLPELIAVLRSQDEGLVRPSEPLGKALAKSTQ